MVNKQSWENDTDDCNESAVKASAGRTSTTEADNKKATAKHSQPETKATVNG